MRKTRKNGSTFFIFLLQILWKSVRRSNFIEIDFGGSYVYGMQIHENSNAILEPTDLRHLHFFIAIWSSHQGDKQKKRRRKKASHTLFDCVAVMRCERFLPLSAVWTKHILPIFREFRECSFSSESHSSIHPYSDPLWPTFNRFKFHIDFSAFLAPRRESFFYQSVAASRPKFDNEKPRQNAAKICIRGKVVHRGKVNENE